MKRQTKTAKTDTKIIDFLRKNPMSNAVQIVAGTGVGGNIYMTMTRLVEKGQVIKLDKNYTLPAKTQKSVSPQRETENKYENDPRMPFSGNRYQSLISTYKKEIDHIQSGIDQLVIAKNYLERRVEEMEDAD